MTVLFVAVLAFGSTSLASDASASKAERSSSASPAAAWTADTAGRVFTLGGAAFHGSVSGYRNSPVIAIAVTPDGGGYWLAALDGSVLPFGDARDFGSMAGHRLNAPVVGFAPTPDGRGYWLVGADGGVFGFGDARYFGSMGSRRLNQPVTSIAPTATGRGYWLVARDGGVFGFGDARFYGSMGSRQMNAPVDTFGTTRDGKGYWLLGRDGGVFGFGDAHFYGSALGTTSLPVGLLASPTSHGYWIGTTSDTIHAFGDAPPLVGPPSSRPVVGVANTRAASNGYALPLLEYLAARRTHPVFFPRPHQVALTFDDGPSSYTQGVLAVLTRMHIPATFFVVGHEAATNVAILQTEHNAGMAIEDHTWDHPDLTRLTPAAIDNELLRTVDVIRTTTGEQPACFRPPYGDTDPTVVNEAARFGLHQVLWNVDPRDWAQPGATVIADRATANANGQPLVIILHDGGGNRSETIAALPTLINTLITRGYQFISLCN